MIVDLLSTLIIFGFIGLISATYFFIINNADVDITKNYWPTSAININLISK